MILDPKTVLLADDDPAVLALYRQGLPAYLPGFEIAAVANGSAAIAYVSSHAVTVLVIDISRPGMNGFEVLAFVRNHHPNLPVVVLSGTAPHHVLEGRSPVGAVQVLQKPVAPTLLAECIRAAHAETTRGRITGVPLAMLVHLVHAERRTCALHLRLGDQRGRLHFLAGDLVNAYAFEQGAEGDAAARHLLSWEAATVEFERSLHNHVRTIRTPLPALLLDVLRASDEMHRTAEPPGAAGVAVVSPARVASAQPADEPVPTGRSPADPLATAAERLHEALADLRHAMETAAADLGTAAPTLRATAAAALSARSEWNRHGSHAARLARASQEVSALAARLYRAAEAMGAPVGERGRER